VSRISVAMYAKVVFPQRWPRDVTLVLLGEACWLTNTSLSLLVYRGKVEKVGKPSLEAHKVVRR
jgi:hypothetical protein